MATAKPPWPKFTTYPAVMLHVSKTNDPPTIPDELSNAFESDNELKQQFNALSPGKQREYADHISSAKQEKTRLSRLEKALPLIKAGKGLYDKYKNC